MQSLDELDIVLSLNNSKTADNNHIFLNFITPIVQNVLLIEKLIPETLRNYIQLLEKLRISQIELKLLVKPSKNTSADCFRIFISNESGNGLFTTMYIEDIDPDTGQVEYLFNIQI